MKNISKLIQLVARRAGTLCLLTMAACAQAADKEAVPELSPKGKVSLEYPNQWDFNDLIGLSNDGRYLIDASKSARYIRVWDWEKKEVVQRLLLNEDNPEHNDNKEHKWVLGVWGGAKLAITPDGRMLAACVSISHNWPSQTDNYVTARIWNLESGAIVADIPGVLRNVPGFGEAVLQASCGSISYSPDGKYMAYASGASFFANDAERDAYEAGLKADSANAAATHKYVRTVKIPDHVSGIALYETSGWKLVKFIPLPNPENKQASNKHVTPSLKSTMLFTEDGKQLIGAVFEQPYYGENKRESNRIMRWDIESGVVLEEKEVPKLAPPSAGVWWHWLPGGREVWWSTHAETHLRQTQAEARNCEAASAAPAFVSEVVENCAYNWAIGILDIEARKIKYLVPFRKNPPQGVKVERQLDVFSAGISPDGTHLVLLSNTSNPITFPPTANVSVVEILDRKTLRPEGSYSWKGPVYSSPSFSGNSRYFTFKSGKASSHQSAMIFELPEDKRK